MIVSIFTRGKNDKLVNLISELQNQTIKPVIRVFSDSFFDYPEVELVYTEGKNISEKRNLAISMALDDDFLFLLDDDNKLQDNQFLEKLQNNYLKIFQKFGCSIISPLIKWRQTQIVQSAGVKFSYVFGKVLVNRKIKGDYWQVKGIGGNSLFGYGRCFKQAKFDKNIGYIREDIDYAYSLGERGVKIFVVNQNIYHLERDKTRLEKSFISGDFFKKKIKNRDIFVKKHGNFFQKLVYWLYGRWVSLFYWLYLRFKDEK